MRLTSQIHATETFKHKKGTLQEEGFDPVNGDTVLLRDDAQLTYVPLTAALKASLKDGSIRL